ncbi:hypothetical protein ACM66B_002154 [Microbotryomycetes sp. NB124-2]
MIRAIDGDSVHRITSGQVVVDLQTAVKELVDNALDAEATSITLTFREHGLDSIEVQDNGRGIPEQDWPSIALKHHTSKLSSFDDLTSVATLGFRGEALSSLCAVAELGITTATAQTAPVGAVLSFDSSGTCTPQGRVARTAGTTATVKDLFKSMPVRRKELQKNVKREFAKALELVQAYALFRFGVRFEVKNIVKGKTTTQLQTPPKSSLRSNFSALFSAKALSATIPLDLEFEVRPDKHTRKHVATSSDEPVLVSLKGLMSKAELNCGKSAGNRQFFALNGRPFLPTKIPRVFNDVYKCLVPNTFPMLAVDFSIATDSYDVNVSPDKRTVYLHSENNLLAALRAALEEWLQAKPNTFVPAMEGQSLTAKVKHQRQASSSDSPAGPSSDEMAEASEAPVARKRRRVAASEEGLEADVAIAVPSSSRDQVGDDSGKEGREPSPTPSNEDLYFNSSSSGLREKKTSNVIGTVSKEALLEPASQELVHHTPSANALSTSQPSLRQFLRPVVQSDNSPVEDVEIEVFEDLQASLAPPRSRTSSRDCSDDSAEQLEAEADMSDTVDVTDPLSAALVDDEHDSDAAILTEVAAHVGSVEEVKPAGHSGQISDCIFLTRLSDIGASWSEFIAVTEQPTAKFDGGESTELEGAGVNSAAAEVENTLSRNVSKEDFGRMDVIGQFNHAFIVARRNTGQVQDDLFIVDQHASDEKYNFEDLQRNTVMQSQKLLQPQSLHLPAHDEMSAIENADVLRLNGFTVEVDEDAQVGHKIKLVAKPVSKDTVFGLDDLEDLLEQISARATSEVARTAKARRMFASRACRKSVMFGKALNQSQMQAILTHMGELHQPWHCPHGRPTMRWLHSLGHLHTNHSLRDELDAYAS